MTISIFGSSGLIGSALSKSLENSYTIHRISGRKLYEKPEVIAGLLGNSHVIINLAGHPVAGRWTKEKKRLIHNSRVITTRNLVDSFHLMEKKPSLFINASAIGIYIDGKIMNENDTDYADNFLARVVMEWEKEASRANEIDIKTAIVRFGIVLSKEGGAYAKLRKLMNLFIAGPIGNGEQGMSVIHVDDAVNAIKLIIKNKITGITNLCIPEPVSNKSFIRTMAKICKRPSVMAVPVFALKLLFAGGHIILSEGQRVYPGVLLSHGFRFEYPEVNQCIMNLEE